MSAWLCRKALRHGCVSSSVALQKGSFCLQSTANVCSFESGGAEFFEFSEKKRDSGD